MRFVPGGASAKMGQLRPKMGQRYENKTRENRKTNTHARARVRVHAGVHTRAHAGACAGARDDRKPGKLLGMLILPASQDKI